MKKSIIAMAVAGALAVPAIASADATLYGWMTMAVDKEKNEKLHVNSDGNSPSRIGLRGTADTGIDGLTALYQYEFGVNQTNGGRTLNVLDEDGERTGDTVGGAGSLTTRLANVGLTGNFGTALFGTQWAPQYSWVTGTTDVMMSSAAYRPTDLGIYRVNNTAAYVSPDFNGLQLAAAVSANSDFEDKNADFYHVAAKYNANGLHAAIGYIDFESSDAFGALSSTTAIALSYDFGPATVAATYSYLKTDGADNYKPWDLAATYSLTDATTLKATYGDYKNSQKAYAVEVQHDLSNMVNTFVGYGHANSNARENETANSVFSTGLRVRF